MIFVTLGTQDKSFHRLLDWIDKLIDEKKIKDKVVVQAGFTKYSSKNMDILDYVSMDEFDCLMNECSILITHGGVGSIMAGLTHQKKVIAIPRLEKFLEHTNDHQVQIVTRLKEEGYILGANSIEELDSSLKEIFKFIPKKYESNTKNLIEFLENYIDEDKMLSKKDRIKELYHQYREVLMYLLFGVLTTIVNIISYYLFTRVIPLGEYVSNIIAWVISVSFAFVTNKLFVFDSKSKNKKILVKELVSFIGFRLLSLGIDMGSMFVMISLLRFNDMIAKILANGIVIVLNYIFSKLFIFKKEV